MLHTKINERIQKVLPDAVIEVDDYKHDGLHLVLTVTSQLFEGLPLLEQHRLVQNALKDLLESGEVHALKIQTRVPEEKAPIV